MSDPFYQSRAWKELRARRLKMDGYRCTVPGCPTPTYRLTVDHIDRRRDTGKDDINRMRTLCGHHDAQVKEAPSGKRRNGGKPYVQGCDATGRPLDPVHPWHPRQAH